MIESILVPCSFDDDSRLVLTFATGLADLGVRRVVITHRVDSSGMEGPVIVAAVDRARDRARELSAVLTGSGLDVEVRICTGETAADIVAVAAEAHVDAILSGTHGKTMLDRLMGGSISEDLLVQADRPNLFCRFRLMRNAENPADLAKRFARTLVVTTDFSEPSMRAFEAAISLPRSAVGMVYLLHVLDGALRGTDLTDAEAAVRPSFDELTARAAERGITARAVLRQGDPGREVLREIDERRATGVVTGSRGRNILTEAVLGSVSMTLLRQASCPVLVVP